MTGSLIVVGGGGVGRETLEVVTAISTQDPYAMSVRGVVDDDLSTANLQRLLARGTEYLGRPQDLPVSDGPETSFVIGIANPMARRRLHELLVAKGYRPAVLIHPSATVGSDVRLGPGTIVGAGARLTTNITSGLHTQIHVNATVGHDTRLADYVSLYPQSAVSGDCTIGPDATIGASAIVLQGLEVSAGAFVGAGGVVVRDVKPGVVVKGVPAA